jgi:hypothetical protein
LNNTPLDVKQIIVPNPEMVSKVLERMTEKYVEVYLSEKSESIAFKSQGIIYLTRLIDARPPGYEMVIDKEVNESITFNQDQLIEVSGKAKKISKESPLVIQIPTVTDEKVEVKVYGKDGASKNDDEVSNLELIGNITATKQSGRFDNTDKDLIIAMGLSNKTDEAKSYYRLSPKVLDRVLAVSKKGSFTFYHPEKPAEYGKYFYHLPPLSGEDKKEVRPVTVKKIKPSASKEAKTTEKPKYDAAFMDKMIKRLRLALKYAPDSAAIQKQIKSLETAKKYAI